MDVRQSALCADRAGDSFSGRTRLRRAQTLAMRVRIDQALFAQGARSGSLAGVVARPRSAQRDFTGEDVADAAHGLDDPRLVRRPLELASEPSDVSVDRAIERRPVVPLNVS